MDSAAGRRSSPGWPDRALPDDVPSLWQVLGQRRADRDRMRRARWLRLLFHGLLLAMLLPLSLARLREGSRPAAALAAAAPTAPGARTGR